ncbi:MAG TPA: lysophospholipid acyltransferase family protein [Allosphingosinicella sp.]|nr:lysophospholipid acyltransferase family protein [Allosphingosinicella sp.]
MRLILRTAAMAAGLIPCIPLHYLWRLFSARSPWPRLYLKWAGRRAGLRVSIAGAPLKDHVLFVSNHVTWLDILALGGATGAIFVSRDDVEDWPVVGWIAGLNDTIYVARQARRQVHGQADRLRRALATGRPVALFPQGTTDLALLPFRPSLFASLFPPLDGVRVQPVALDYGGLAAEVAWIGAEGAGANARRILGRAGTIPVVLRFLAPVDPHQAGDRKALAALAEAEVAAALAASEPAAQPLYAGR